MGMEVCAICPENSYCPGGEYTYSETDDAGINPCPDGSVAPVGMWDVVQCGRKLYINDVYIYLRRAQQTTPSLHIDADGDGTADYFANATTYDVAMNKNTDHRLNVKMGDVVYFVHDDTIDGTASMPRATPAESEPDAPVEAVESDAPDESNESEPVITDESTKSDAPVDEQSQ
jgi:hypothetical protein